MTKRTTPIPWQYIEYVLGTRAPEHEPAITDTCPLCGHPVATPTPPAPSVPVLCQECVIATGEVFSLTQKVTDRLHRYFLGRTKRPDRAVASLATLGFPKPRLARLVARTYLSWRHLHASRERFLTLMDALQAAGLIDATWEEPSTS